MIKSWHCENIYTGSTFTFTGQDCIASTTVSGTPQNPLVVRDDGSLVFGVGILIFFSAIMFFGLVFNSFDFKK